MVPYSRAAAAGVGGENTEFYIMERKIKIQTDSAAYEEKKDGQVGQDERQDFLRFHPVYVALSTVEFENKMQSGVQLSVD